MALGGKIVTYYNGEWKEGNTPIIGAADHASWLGSTVFDGARQFDGVRPDLFLNCQRIVYSAEVMGMISPVTPQEVFDIVEEGCKMFAPETPLYIRPMMWAQEGTTGIIDIAPESTGFSVCIEEFPLPEIGSFSLTVSKFRRPRQDMAMTEAKAGSLYANNGRIMADARARGFSNALSLDSQDNVAETASTNVFMIRDGEVFTPIPNGTFLNGLNRQRVIKLLRADGVTVHETKLTLKDFDEADEMFCTGNIAKVMPVAKYQDRVMPDCPIAMRARELYFDFSHSKFAAEDVA
ncbi:branched chain amino acid aminotransferase [Amylibacter kogurei]|uniref:Probable branched-chain-amino-acid aminotransferase n=1 Tax=Paramylibacter kogurei TaxID=1889778 RepID=A0A2G5KAR3_9RHOB|nr:branched-chain amino acid aminotransferase [Amylibacter kogurei]PIB26123.1 branched chain amino acid aminotransferase [Amylibacter kogurei]